MTDAPGFEVEAGDTVRWYTKNGFQTGYFVRINRNGAPVVRRPNSRKERVVDTLFPVNDTRMVKQRGQATLSGYNDDAPKKRARRR